MKAVSLLFILSHIVWTALARVGHESAHSSGRLLGTYSTETSKMFGLSASELTASKQRSPSLLKRASSSPPPAPPRRHPNRQQNDGTSLDAGPRNRQGLLGRLKAKVPPTAIFGATALGSMAALGATTNWNNQHDAAVSGLYMGCLGVFAGTVGCAHRARTQRANARQQSVGSGEAARSRPGVAGSSVELQTVPPLQGTAGASTSSRPEDPWDLVRRSTSGGGAVWVD